MKMSVKTDDQPAVLRGGSLDTEQRVNVIRIAAIALFYLVHLWHVSAPRLGETAASIIGFDINQPVSSNVHIVVTILCLGWLMQAFAIHFLAERELSERAILLTCMADLVWLTSILCCSTGPVGPLVAGYFLIIMLSALRLDLRLIRATTIGAVGGYLVLLGAARWPMGLLKEVNLSTVPRYHQLMTVLALIFAGVIMDRLVRKAYDASDDRLRDNRKDQL